LEVKRWKSIGDGWNTKRGRYGGMKGKRWRNGHGRYAGGYGEGRISQINGEGGIVIVY